MSQTEGLFKVEQIIKARGTVTLDTLLDDRELLMGILKFGPDVEVLAPPALRERVAEALTAARRLYRRSSPSLPAQCLSARPRRPRA